MMQRQFAIALVCFAGSAALGCSDEPPPASSTPSSGGGGTGGAAGGEPWENPGCDAPPLVPSDALARLEVSIDLGSYLAGDYAVTEKIVVRAEEPGSAVTLFGVALDLGRASHGYAYDGQRATFCVPPFEAGEEIALDIEYRISIEQQALGPANVYGIHLWGDAAGAHVVGAYSAPFLTPTWLLAPHTAPWIDAEHDDNASVDAVELAVAAPDPSWTVIGPGRATIEDDVWRFSIAGRMPLNTLSFAASPSYVPIDAGASASGVEIFGAVFPAAASAATGHLAAAREGVDWMETSIGSWIWPTDLSFAEVPGYPGGFEHTSAVWLGSVVLGSGQGDYVAIHEAVHHWWGNAVRIADWSHFWLSEGFTEWTTVFGILEALDPESALELQAEYRSEAASLSYPAAGPLRFADSSTFAQQLNENGLFFYRYGAAFLEMVHQRLVREHATDLPSVLAAWYAEKQGEAATTEEFRDFLGAHTGDAASWSALFDDWVFQTPCPTLELGSYAYDGQTISFVVRRTGGAGQALDMLELSAAGSSVVAALAAGEDEVAVTIPVVGEPPFIVVDPDGLYILRLTQEQGWAGPAVTHTH